MRERLSSKPLTIGLVTCAVLFSLSEPTQSRDSSLTKNQIKVQEAAETVGKARVGDHVPLFAIEKDENPQNVMVVFTQVDEGCNFKDSSNQKPVFDFYWLMDRSRYKPVNSMLKSGIYKRLEVSAKGPNQSSQQFIVGLRTSKELKHDIKEPALRVTSERKNNSCEVSALMDLGPEDGDKTIQVKTIYAETRKTLLPPFRKVKSVTIEGFDLNTNQLVRRTYAAR